MTCQRSWIFGDLQVLSNWPSTSHPPRPGPVADRRAPRDRAVSQCLAEYQVTGYSPPPGYLTHTQPQLPRALHGAAEAVPQTGDDGTAPAPSSAACLPSTLRPG